MGAGGGGGGDGSTGAEEPSKRHKSISTITKIFPFPNNIGALGMPKMEPVQHVAGGYSMSRGGCGGGGPSRMDTSYGASSLDTSHTSTSSSGSVRSRPQQSQPVMAFAGGGNNGSKSFLPGMDGSIPQPLPLTFQAGAASSSPSSGSSSSCSSPQQYGAGATAAAGGGGAQRSQPPPAAWNIPFSAPQMIMRNGDGDGDFDSRPNGGGMGHVAEVGEPEAGGGSNTAGGAAAATAGAGTGRRLGGGGHLPPLSLGMSVGGGAGYPALLDHHRASSSQSRPSSQDAVTLRPCAPYTMQQSLSRQAANGGGGSAQAGWGGAAAARTTGAGLPSYPASSAGGVADQDDKEEFDFLGVFF